MKLTRKEAEQFSLARMVAQLANPDGLQHGFESEVCREAAGSAFDVHRPIVPWAVLARRDLQAAASGSSIVGTDTLDLVDILRPWSVTLQAGVQVLPGLEGNVVIPRVSASAVAYWLADETTAISPSQPALGQIAMTPKTAGSLIRFTRTLNLQVPALDGYLRRELLRTMGTLLDGAVLSGAGSSGQPQGIVGTSGVGSQSGTGLAWSGVLSMLSTVAAADATDAHIRFIGTPATRELLQQRDRGTDSGRFIWDDNEVAGKQASVTSDLPPDSLLAGDFSQVLVGFWGNGIQLAVNPYQTFNTGVIAARALALVDVAVLHPAAFCVAESIT